MSRKEVVYLLLDLFERARTDSVENFVADVRCMLDAIYAEE